MGYIVTMTAIVTLLVVALLLLEYVPPLWYMYRKKKQRGRQKSSEIDFTQIALKKLREKNRSD